MKSYLKGLTLSLLLFPLYAFSGNRCDLIRAETRAGDLIFVEIKNFLFDNVAKTQNHWSNHVGIVVKNLTGTLLVAESTLPVSKLTPLCDFVKKGEKGRVALKRLKFSLSAEQENRIFESAKKRLNLYYHTGFNFDSKSRSFCSKFVHEVLLEALGVSVGRKETFRQLFENTTSPEVINFWRVWFGGFIPWSRNVLSPASQFFDPQVSDILEF